MATIEGFAEDLKQRYEACGRRGRVNYSRGPLRRAGRVLVEVRAIERGAVLTRYELPAFPHTQRIATDWRP